MNSMEIETGIGYRMWRDEHEGIRLFAPHDFWKLSLAARQEWDCGPARFGKLKILNRIYRLDVKIACSIHDYMYAHGTGECDRWYADVTFLNNLVKIIERKSSNPLTRMLRRYRAMTYFIAVRELGQSSFNNAEIPASARVRRS